MAGWGPESQMLLHWACRSRSVQRIGRKDRTCRSPLLKIRSIDSALTICVTRPWRFAIQSKSRTTQSSSLPCAPAPGGAGFVPNLAVSPPHGLAPWEAKLAPPPHKVVGPARTITTIYLCKTQQYAPGSMVSRLLRWRRSFGHCAGKDGQVRIAGAHQQNRIAGAGGGRQCRA